MSEGLTNDTRQEANVALMEVEKGLRSSRVGDQCEAIVKFPSLIDRFPFPILINAAYLKLAEVYRTSINFLRLNILKVLQVTEKHLNKITSVDEFLRRIYSVIHSNDPIARAVTMRVFGSIASIVADKKNVHHSIHHGLESTDQVEASAAIYATHCLCEHSAIFAAGVYDKIATMIQGLTTPVEKKLDLIPILDLMHHDTETVTQVRDLCVRLLLSHPSLSLVSALLQTLTTLTLHTLVHSTDQVKLLLYYAQGDSRKVIRQKALSQLNKLVSQVPHIWSKNMIQGLYLVVDRAGRDKEKSSGLHALYILSLSAAVHNMTFLKDKLLPFTYSQSASLAIYSIGVVTNIIVAMHKKGVCECAEVVEVVKMTMEVCLLTDFRELKEHCLFKVALSSLVRLTGAHHDVSQVVLDCLLSLLPLLLGVHASVVCQALVSTATITSGAWMHIIPKLMEYLDNTANTQQMLVPVTAVFVQLFASEFSQEAREEHMSLVLPKLLSLLWGLEHPSRLWLAYKVARKASIMGIHEISMPIYSRLSKLVTAVKYRNWLNALCQFCEAQSLVLSAARKSATYSDLISSLCQSSSMVHNAIMFLKASDPPSLFGVQFLSVHASWLSTHSQLLATCVSLSTMPPPSSDLSRSTEKKFQECVSQFQLLSQMYDKLYTTLFDADPSTLEYVTLLQQSCLLMASIISSITCSRRPLVSPKPSTPSSGCVPVLAPVEMSDNFNTKFLLGQICRSVYQRAQSAGESIQSLPIGEKHSSLLKEFCQMLLSVPVCLPQYMFVSLQQTTVKLALSPPIPPTGQHTSLILDTHLTLKVEGVIQHAGKQKMYRSLRAVHVRVKPEVEKLVSHNTKTLEPKTLELTEPVEKDYFQTQFVLALPLPGYYVVHIEASLLDNHGTVWHTGHKETLPVVVNTEENLKLKSKENLLPRPGSGDSKQPQRNN